jgi:predicted amidohydrolase YtcJ
MRYFFRTGILAGCAILLLLYACTSARNTDMILKNGKIITVNDSFAIAQAVAVENDRIIAVGTNAEIDRLTRKNTKVIDLQGRSVIPGLIDAHLHPESASLSELDGEIPDLHSIADLLAWIKSQAEKINENEWIIHPKLFFTA